MDPATSARFTNLGSKIDAQVALYELITGRKARGVLILAVPDASLKQLSALPKVMKSFDKSERKPNIIGYSYKDLGFEPGPRKTARPHLLE